MRQNSLALRLQLEGKDVRTAEDGHEALQVAGEYRPHVVFLDIRLPGVSGYQVAHRIRETPHLKDPLLVAMGASGSEGDRLGRKQEGFDAYMAKPVESSEITALLAELRRQAAPSPR